MIEAWSTLLYTLFVRDVFGSKLLFGLFILLGFLFFAFKMRMSFDSMAISFVALLLFLAGYSVFTNFPTWIVPLVIMALGLIIAFAMLRIGRR